eukprot:jgi/Mesvir1/28117/Mv04697-RA.1
MVQYMDAILAAVARGVPVYIVGGTTGNLLSSLRLKLSALRSTAGNILPSAAPGALINFGVLVEDAARQLASRLISLGIRRMDCMYTSEQNTVSRAQCAALEQAFSGAGLVGATRLCTRAFVPMTQAVEAIAADMASRTPGIGANETALVFMDTVMYELVRDIKLVTHLLQGCHMAVFETSSSALWEARAGRPVTVVDRPLYSEAYAAVALAAYELQTGLALTEDLPSSVRVLSMGEVKAEDMVREACREEGYPVCGDPGVADVSPGGCPCFRPSSMRLQVLASIPIETELHAEIMAGLLDGQRDFAGTSYEWDMATDEAFQGGSAASSTNASLLHNDWSAVLSLDHFLAPVDPTVGAAMQQLGAAKTGRPYWLGMVLHAVTPAGSPAAMQLISAKCTSSDYQALVYPDSLAGGRLHMGCLDWQVQLVTYGAYMLSVLHARTMGERLLQGELPTGVLVSRASAQQRRADCLLYRRDRTEQLSLASFPICDYTAGCGANVSTPCSGKGECRFPSAEKNAQSQAGLLLPSVGACVCASGHEGEFCEIPKVVHDNDRLMRVLLVVAGLVVLALGLIAGFLWLQRCRRASLVHKRRKKIEERKKRPPAQNQPMAVVFTDIEGSTALWEWDSTIMSQCVQIHHRVIRTLLPKHCGYESNTEGDAFELVFHDASDALLWAMETQLALLHPESILGPTRGGSNPPLPFRWPEQLLTHPLAALVVDTYGTTIYRGLRVRMGIHVGVPENTYQHPNGRQRYLGGAVDIAKAVGDAPDQGGQVLMSMDAWASLDTPAPMVGGLPIVVFNMGEHEVVRDAPPIQLMQVLPQSLLRRIPFRPLRSLRHLSPSFFEAPGNHFFLTDESPGKPVAILFTFIEAGPRHKAIAGYSASVQLLSRFTREVLYKHHGYECEEKDGNFLLAFGGPLDAALFTQELQVGAMDLPWLDSLLDHPVATEVLRPPCAPANASIREVNLRRNEGSPRGIAKEPALAPKDKFLFRGLRIKCGFYWGIPTMCLPHASTGRAAYFGPLMNRAARIASAAASGQTLCNAEAVEALQDAMEVQEPDLLFTALGPATLKGVSAPVPIFQVSCSAIRARSFPRLRALRTSKNLDAGAEGGSPGWYAPGQHLPLPEENLLWSPAETNRTLRRLPSVAGSTPPDTQWDARSERRGSRASTGSSQGRAEPSGSLHFGSQLTRWEADLAILFQADGQTASEKEAFKRGTARRSRDRMSLDSLMLRLDERLTALGMVADKVLPLPSRAARSRLGKVSTRASDDEVYGDSPLAAVEGTPYLHAMSFPEVGDGGIQGGDVSPAGKVAHPFGGSSPRAAGSNADKAPHFEVMIGQ